MKKKKKWLSVLALSSLVLTACGDDFDVDNYAPLSFSEISSNRAVSLAKTLSKTEQENLVYSFINSSIMVSEDNLIKVGEKEFNEVTKMLDGVDKVIQGKKVKKPDGTEYLSSEFADALLLEFARTPYTWKRTNQQAVGFDASSRLYFVDVTYTTTGEYKKVIPDSRIVNGSPLEEQLKADRYKEYIAFMNAKTKGNDMATSLYTAFQNRWGNVSTILEEQQGRTLLERMQLDTQPPLGLGGYTYSGLLEDNNMKQGADMTIRYIFKYNYNLGEETSLNVESLYVKDFALQGHEQYSELEEDTDSLVAQSLDLLKPFIRNTLLSYQRAVQSHNKIGLHNLYTNYGKYDKYYQEKTDILYTNFGEMAMKIVSRDGTEVKVIVERQVRERPKYTNMTMPTYREKVLYNMVLSNDDKVRIKNSYLLQRTLVGEPTSIVKKIEGVSDQIQYSSTKFSEANEEKVMEVLKRFMQIVYSNDTSSNEFSGTIDLGVGNNTMAKIMENIQAVKSNKKFNYIVSWGSRTNSYVSLNIREIFEVEGYNLDTEAVVELVNRGNSWFVINYQRNVAVKTASGKISSNKGVFSMNTPEGSVDVKLNEDTGQLEVSDEQAVPTDRLEETVEEENAESTEEVGTEQPAEPVEVEPTQEVEATEQNVEPLEQGTTTQVEPSIGTVAPPVTEGVTQVEQSEIVVE